jgi:aldose 1-epimerase
VKLLSLRAGRLAVDLAPEAGGSIARFAVDGATDLLRLATPQALASGRGNDAACYPLVPFSGRIANGCLTFDGEDIRLEPNWPGQRHPMHGDGWARPWTIVQSDECSAEIEYRHDARKGWPFRYRARQTYRLDDGDALIVGMSLENLERRTVPAGLGLHPFFVRDSATRLLCHTRSMWRTDAEVLPVERIDIPSQASFSTSRTVDDVELDNAFEGWDGKASITWPGVGLGLELSASEPFRDMVIFIPPGRSYFCVEPVSHVPGALGATRLAAGATLKGEIVFRVTNL